LVTDFSVHATSRLKPFVRRPTTPENSRQDNAGQPVDTESKPTSDLALSSHVSFRGLARNPARGAHAVPLLDSSPSLGM